MKGFCPLASGSKGNAIYLGSSQTHLLIDAGISCRSIENRLSSIGVSLDQIDAILITHDHTDHIAGLRVICDKWNIPIIANAETAKGIIGNLHIAPNFKIFTTGEEFEIGDFTINSFSVQHDTLDPVGFIFKLGELKIGICADLGYVTTLVEKNLQDCDYLYIEANHEISMVHSSNRPIFYKQRVLGRQGHLSNAECANLLTKILNDKLKHVHLAHLSSECNNEIVAQKVIWEMLAKHGYKGELSIAYQDTVSKAILF